MKSNPFNLVTHPNVYEGHQYALNVVNGLIPACIYTIGACQRYLDDLENSESESYLYFLNIDRAERYLRLVQKFEHVIGNWKTPNIVYEPWQKFIWMNIIGWRWKSEDRPRFRVAHVEVPRGNAKSAQASQAALFFLSLDNPKGNVVDCFATKKDQARIVLDSSRAMARKARAFLNKTGTKVLAHKIVHEKSDSSMKALSSDEDSMDGLNSILSIMDELHAMSRELFDVVYSGMSKRNDSLMLCITTAGFNNDSVGYSQSQYAKKICIGETTDDQFFAIIYTVDEGDDLYSEISWRKANPNYGVSVDPVTFEAKAIKAKNSPPDLPNFKVKHLNIWLSEAKAYYSAKVFDECKSEIKLEDFHGEKCYVALDLASKIDLAGYTIIFKKIIDGSVKYFWFSKAFLPQATFDEEKVDIYHTAKDAGDLIVTPGNAINYEKIQEILRDDLKDFDVQGIHYDPWNATQMAQNLSSSFTMIEFRMTVANLSEPMKMLDADMRSKNIFHNGSKLLRWNMLNVMAKEDANGNVFPLKSNKKLKIDLAVASIMCYAGWIQREGEESHYENNDLLIL